MPKTKKPRELPERADNVPPLPGVKLEDALRAAMATKLPKGWKPPKKAPLKSECPSEAAKREEE